MDETGGQGTAKVTIEFTNVDQGLKFYQEQAGTSQPAQEPKAEAPKEEAPQGPPQGQPQQKPQAQGPQLPTPGPGLTPAGASLKFAYEDFAPGEYTEDIPGMYDAYHTDDDENTSNVGSFEWTDKVLKEADEHFSRAHVVPDVDDLISYIFDVADDEGEGVTYEDAEAYYKQWQRNFNKKSLGYIKQAWKQRGHEEDIRRLIKKYLDRSIKYWASYGADSSEDILWNYSWGQAVEIDTLGDYLLNLPPEDKQMAKSILREYAKKRAKEFKQMYEREASLNINKYAVNVQVIPVTSWQRGKIDPTEYDITTDTIRVRGDYDVNNDPAGWMVHEKVHATLAAAGQQNNSGNYPDNPIEERAYKTQFNYLKSLGHTFDDIFQIPTMEHKAVYKNIFAKWWNASSPQGLPTLRTTSEVTASADEIHTTIRVKRVLEEMGVDEEIAAQFATDVKPEWQEYIELPDEAIYEAYQNWKDEVGPRKMTNEDWDQRGEEDTFNREQFGSKKASLKFSQTEEDYDFYNDNYRFNSGEEHECEDCGAPGAKLYNTFGQKLQIGGFSSDLELCDNCHKERFPEHWRYKKKASYIYKPGEQIGYHGREGRIVREDNGGYIVYFTDTNEEQWLDKEELLEQEGLKEPENEFDKVLKLRDRARERRDTDMSKETNFTLWFNKNKNETSYWEGYSNFIKTAAQHKQFKDWMKEKFADVVIEDEPETKDGAAYELPDGSGFMTGTVGSKQASGVALNILPDLFEDKFAMSKIPPELRLLRSNAKQALSKVVEHMQVLGRESTPADFPMEWFYKDQGYVVPDSIGEVRAQLQEIIDYANRATGNNFYGNMKSSFKVISKSGLQGVEIIRELIDGKINKYGYINEKNQFVVLPNYRELRINSQLNRPDTGETVKVIKYVDVSLGSTANMVETLMKKKAGDEADDLAEKEWSDKGEEDWSRKPSEGFIPTNRGMQTPDDIVSDLTFLNYAYNRDRSPEITPERWAKVYGPNTETMEMRYQREKASGKTFTKKDINKAFIKYAIDVSDEIPPMGWDASTPGKPAGAGAPKEPMQGLQDKDKEQEEKKNVIYDSSSDTGPQFQTTINPATKEVTVKFMDSPQKEALDDAMKTQMQSPQLPTLNTTPQNNQGTPGTPGGPGANEEPNQFKNQQVPVSF
jgi:hypothetical protein